MNTRSLKFLVLTTSSLSSTKLHFVDTIYKFPQEGASKHSFWCTLFSFGKLFLQTYPNINANLRRLPFDFESMDSPWEKEVLAFAKESPKSFFKGFGTVFVRFRNSPGSIRRLSFMLSVQNCILKESKSSPYQENRG